MIPAAVLLALALPTQQRRTPVVEVVERAGPAVVNISAEVIEQNPFQRGRPHDDFWRDFFEGARPRERTHQSLGSGVIIDPSGLVLTNEHVVSKAARITVSLRDRRKFEVDVVAADPEFDIAVLKIRGGKNLPAVEMGRSNDLMPGETVVAIGNPFGLSSSVTTGVVSALHRSVQAGNRVYEDFVQTDAAINPGNSGGALLSIEGKLIGINTAIYQSANGIGFAIPIDKAMAVADEVLKYGEVRPVFLGINVDPRSEEGALVRRVYPGTPAASAGLRADDRIIDIGGSAVERGRDFWKHERSLITGQKVQLRVRRRREILSVELIAKEMSVEQATKIGREALGLTVRSGKEGLLVVSEVAKGSDAAAVGIRKGDFLLSIAGRSMRSPAEFDAMCARLRGAEAVAVIVGRGRRQYYVTLQLH